MNYKNNLMKTKFENLKNLSFNKVIEGCNLCFKNSDNLYSCALALKRNKKYGVAISLLILSVEELMKSYALFGLLLFGTDEKLMMKDIFESNEMHKKRLDFALMINELFKSVNLENIGNQKDKMDTSTKLLEFANKINNKIDIKKISNNIDQEKKTFNNWFAQANNKKEDGFYVAYNNKWHNPTDIKEDAFIKALNETKIIRNDISKIMNAILSIDEKEFGVFLNVFNKIKANISF
jgi:AbiV family abortive infection protein